jgi:hypothetical protein
VDSSHSGVGNSALETARAIIIGRVFYIESWGGTMRNFSGVLLVVALVGAAARSADPAEDPKARVAEQKKKAEANWETARAGEFAHLETKHLLLYAPQAWEKQLPNLGAVLEKQFDLAWKALQFEDKKDDLPGKVTVYLFAVREPFTTYLRLVAKRRVRAEDEGAFSAADDDLHAAAGPPRKGGFPVEALAGEQIAGLLLARKAGKNTPLPAWLLSGFGRATYCRAVPTSKAVLDDRKRAARLARSRSAADVWNGTADAAEMDILAGSVVDFLAYGPGYRKFPSFVVGFQPGENMDSRTAAQAMEAAGLKGETIDRAWKAWAVK